MIKPNWHEGSFEFVLNTKTPLSYDMHSTVYWVLQYFFKCEVISDCLGKMYVTAIQKKKKFSLSKSAIKIIILLVTLKRGKLKGGLRHFRYLWTMSLISLTEDRSLVKSCGVLAPPVAVGQICSSLRLFSSLLMASRNVNLFLICCMEST